MSARVSLRVTGGIGVAITDSCRFILGDAVGAGDQLQRVHARGRPVCSAIAVLARWQSPATTSPPALLDLARRASWRSGSRCPRSRPAAPHAVDAGALLDQLHLGAGELHQVTALEADVLGPQVTRRVVGDRARARRRRSRCRARCRRPCAPCIRYSAAS